MGQKSESVFGMFSPHLAVGGASRVYLDTNGLKNRSIIFEYVHVDYTTTSMDSIYSCGAVVRQD